MYILRSLEEIRSDFLTNVFSLFTALSEEIIVLGILCTLYWCINKRLAYRICFAYFVSGMVIQSLKITFRYERPWIIDKDFKPVESAIKGATGYSFPSGHTQTATALYGSIACNTKRKWIQAICFFLVIGVAFSRMYLGVHTLRDVLTSFIVSAVLIVIVNFLIFDQLLDQRKILICSFIFLLSVAVITYAILLMSMGVIESEYAKDCCKAGGAGIGFAIGWYVESKFIRFSEKACKPSKQVIKCVLGIAGALIIKTGLKYILSESIPADIVRNMLLVLWVLVLFPMIIKKYFTQNDAIIRRET